MAVTTINSRLIVDGGVQTNDLANAAVTASKLGVLTTKGDLLGFDTAHNRVAVGTNGQFLVADSTQAAGIKWGNATTTVGTNIADTTSVANTTTKTAVTPGILIPANSLTAGKTLYITIAGNYGSTGTPTLTLDLWGNYPNIGVDGATFTTLGGSSGRFIMQLVLTCRTVGTSGTVTVGGYLAAEASTNFLQPMGQASITWNTTIDVTLNPVFQWSAASASNTAKVRIFTVQQGLT